LFCIDGPDVQYVQNASWGVFSSLGSHFLEFVDML